MSLTTSKVGGAGSVLIAGGTLVTHARASALATVVRQAPSYYVELHIVRRHVCRGLRCRRLWEFNDFQGRASVGLLAGARNAGARDVWSPRTLHHIRPRGAGRARSSGLPPWRRSLHTLAC